VDADLQAFYYDLLDVLKKPIFRDGQWRLLECIPAWDGNGSFDSFLAFAWEGTDGRRSLIAVNYASHAGQCYVRLPFSELAEQQVRFRDLMSEALYEREGNEVLSRGIYLDLPAWGYHIFELSVPVIHIAQEISLTVQPIREIIPA